VVKGGILKLFKFLICLFVSCLCLFIVFRKVDIDEVSYLLFHIDYRWLLIATLLGIFKARLTGSRWRYLAPDHRRLSSTQSFYFYAVGVMTNMTLPFRIGDILRARLIADNLKIPKTKALGTIASEHVIDFGVLCSLLLICLTLYSYHWPSQVSSIVNIFLVIITAVLGGIFILRKCSRLVKKLEAYLNQMLPEGLLFLPQMIGHFLSGLFQFDGAVNGIKIILFTIGIWLAQGLWIYALLCSLGIAQSYHLGFEPSLVLMVMMGIAVMIPSSPGYIGTFHLMVMLGLSQMGIPKSIALTYAILSHAHAVAIAILLGTFSIWKGHIKISFNSQNNNSIIQELP